MSDKFNLRYYQKEVIANFIYYLESYSRRKRPTQLLHHMATGSGKTLVMVANILYLYKQGYRKFIFFVDRTDTIEKTKNNFLNKDATKYLFSDKISIDGKEVNIREVENFGEVNEDDINLLFDTIQGIYSKLDVPRENAVTYEDFSEERIVLLSDEAHHINALTKSKSKTTKSDEKNIGTWEGTINKIFKMNSENVLLEYTATVPVHPDIKKKYDDKIIYQYPLEKFRTDKYSKEVEVLEGDFERDERALRALILSQYRRKIAEKHNLHLKPVILFKSKRISLSEEFEEKFHNFIKNLKVSDLAEIKNHQGVPILNKAFKFFEENGIFLENLVKEFKVAFGKGRCTSINSQNDSKKKQVMMNTLEDKDNKIRVIFAVDKLTEGWDVLNLFDIVRLDETRGSKHGKPGKTTIREAQLIGRGARYFPFKLSDDQDKYRRKYDGDVKNELRVLEELYYHCYSEPRYISELKTALEDTGIMPKSKREKKLRVKDSFKQSSFWKNGLIFMNKRKETDRSEVSSFSDFNVSGRYKHGLRTRYSATITIFEEEEVEVEEKKTKNISLSEFRESIVRKALNRIEFFKFHNLRKYFPNLSSIREFISSEEYLGGVKVEVTGSGNQIKNLKTGEKLEITHAVCMKISQEIESNSSKYKGTKVFVEKPVNELVKDRVCKFDSDEIRGRGKGVPMKGAVGDLRLDLSKKEWYVYDENYGTTQEKYFVKFLNNMIDKLGEKYDDVYLVRNERLFRLYSFSDGRAFEPDFVLHLKERNSSNQIQYQLFVEPKGKQFRGADDTFKSGKEWWKEEFLKDIKEKHETEVIAENDRYRIVGLQFYNEDITKENFRKELESELNLN